MLNRWRGMAAALLRRVARALDPEHITLEARLRDQIALTHAIVQRAPNAIFLKDPEGRFTMVNRGWSEMSGIPEERAVGRTVHELYPADIARRFAQEDDALLAQGAGAPTSEAVHAGPRPGQWRIVRKTVLTRADGTVQGLVGSSTDISEMKRIEAELRDQYALTNALIEGNPSAMYLKDTRGRYVTVNDAWLKMVGITREQALGRTVLELFPEKESERYHAEDLRLLEDGLGPSEVESLRTGPDGKPQWVIIRKALLRRADGEVIGLIGANTDITRLKAAEAELGERASFIAGMVDALPISVAMRDVEGRYQLVNRMWERYFGIQREEILGKRRRDLPGAVSDAVRAEDTARIEALDRDLLARGPDYLPEPVELTRKGRSYFITSRVLGDSAGKPIAILSAGLDTTERRATEAALAFEQRRLDLVVRAARVGIVDWNGRTHETYYSPIFREILGYPPDADTSQWPDYFKVLIHPDDREGITRRWVAFVKGKGLEGREGQFYEQEEYRLQRKDGTYAWVQASGIALRDQTGFVTRWIAAISDITERRAQEEALRASVRLREEVERMSRHDLKTPMNSVIAMSRLLREGGKLAREDEEMLASIERAGFRIVDMVNLSLDLFRMERGAYDFRPRAVDLLDVARRVAEDLRGQAASKGVQIAVEDLDSLPARAEELLCYSMLANLIKNAIEAAPDGSRVTITAEGRGEAVLVHIHNAGAVPEPIRARFFDKYATAGKSAGLGLGTYSARLMARVQEGDITLNTSDAEGTTISVRFRAAAERAVPAANEAARQAAENFVLERKRVLVVDDDEFNRMVMRRLLPTPPLEVELAVNGRAALDCARRTWPDTVFLDLEMPVMDGYEAARRLRELEREKGHARCTIVAVSSNDEDVIVKRALESGCDHYIVKPASREALMRVLSGRAPLPSGGQPAAEGHASDPIDLDPDLEPSLPAFLQSRRQALDDMLPAVGRDDRVAFKRLAHKLAGSFSLYGFRWAAAQCRALERDATAGAAEDLAQRARAVRAHLDQVHVRIAARSA